MEGYEDLAARPDTNHQSGTPFVAQIQGTLQAPPDLLRLRTRFIRHNLLPGLLRQSPPDDRYTRTASRHAHLSRTNSCVHPYSHRRSTPVAAEDRRPLHARALRRTQDLL